MSDGNSSRKERLYRQLSSPLDTVTEEEVTKQLSETPRVTLTEKRPRLLHKSSSLTDVGKLRSPLPGRLSTKSEGGRRRRRGSLQHNTLTSSLTWYNVSSYLVT